MPAVFGQRANSNAMMVGCAAAAVVIIAFFCYNFLGAQDPDTYYYRQGASANGMAGRARGMAGRGKALLKRMLGANSGGDYSPALQRYGLQGANDGENYSAATQRLGLLGTSNTESPTLDPPVSETYANAADEAAAVDAYGSGTFDDGVQDASANYVSLEQAYSNTYDPNAQDMEIPDTRVGAPVYPGAFDDDKSSLTAAYGNAYTAAAEPSYDGTVGSNLAADPMNDVAPAEPMQAQGAAMAPGYMRMHKRQGMEVVSHSSENSRSLLRPRANYKW